MSLGRIADRVAKAVGWTPVGRSVVLQGAEGPDSRYFSGLSGTVVSVGDGVMDVEAIRTDRESGGSPVRLRLTPRDSKSGASVETDPFPVVDQVAPGKPAEAAGMRAGDRIVAVDGRPARSPSDVANATNAKPGVPIVFRVARDGGESDVTVVPEGSEQGGRRVGLAGLRLKVDPESARRVAITVRSGPLDALGQGARKTWELSTFTLRMLGRMITGDASLRNLSGPITLADYAGQSAQAGVLVFVGYLALISISLGVLNLLPIPLLDGGHLLYYLAEIILGRPVSDRAFEVGQRIGMALLAVLMTLALVNDVSRLF